MYVQLPSVLIATVLLCMAVFFTGGVVFKTRKTSENAISLKVGYVGKLDSYMGLNLNAVADIVSEKFGITFVHLDLEEAERQMLLGTLSTYIIIPDGFVNSLDTGANDRKIVYVTGAGDLGISGTLLKETVDSVSKIIESAQASFFGAYDLINTVEDKNLKTKIEAVIEDDMTSALVGAVGMVGTESLGMSNSLSFIGYYFCAIELIFLSFSGLSFTSFFTRRNRELRKICLIHGCNNAKQVISEYIAFSVFQMICFLIVAVITYFTLSISGLYIRELSLDLLSNFSDFIIKMIPVCLMFYSLQFFIFELTGDAISAIVAQFITALGLGYLSGFYYPVSFLPEKLTGITKYFPTGAALNYADSLLMGSAGTGFLLLIIGYFILFLVLSVLVRNYTEERRANEKS